ncbi:NUDIX hydrolase [Candidatus Falkowbacteria bacterium]|nr:NUDIX hydrolase [Candidatus Falkowbacteria bacterium]
MQKIIIASGPVIVENGKVLLNKHGNDDFWKFCGGRIENFDENLEEAAKREVKEEMGVDVEIIDPTPFLLYASKKLLDDRIDVILVHFNAKRIGEIKVGEDIREWKWIALEDLQKELLAPNILPTLKHFGYLRD